MEAIEQKKVLIRQALILDNTSEFHEEKADILIDGGQISRIDSKISSAADIEIRGEKLHVAPGFFDIGTQHGDPGFEHREDFASLAAAAFSGGYTGLAVMPNSAPAVDSKSGVSYVAQHSKKYGVALHPIGALSTGTQGGQLAELFDMHHHGAPAFSDGRNPAHNGALLLRALEYVKSFRGLVINRPEDAGLSAGGQMHEGPMSTSLGLPGIPGVAEVAALQRDIQLLRYADSKLLCHSISSGHSTALIEAAKSEKLKIYASVAAMNLAYNDERLLHFDKNFKLQPPLRQESDRLALIEAVKNGTIDLIVSNHEPLDFESAEKELPYADFGAATLEICFALSYSALKGSVKIGRLTEILSRRPREILGIEVPVIARKNAAELVVFETQVPFAYPLGRAQTKGVNVPALPARLQGAIRATIAHGHMVRAKGA